MNERDDATEYPLTLADVERMLGGRNTLKAGQVLDRVELHADLHPFWACMMGERDPEAPVLLDMETGDTVACLDKDNEKYGPLYVPYHNYRVLYAEHAIEK
jgi:hypothetical protein